MNLSAIVARRIAYWSWSAKGRRSGRTNGNLGPSDLSLVEPCLCDLVVHLGKGLDELSALGGRRLEELGRDVAYDDLDSVRSDEREMRTNAPLLALVVDRLPLNEIDDPAKCERSRAVTQLLTR